MDHAPNKPRRQPLARNFKNFKVQWDTRQNQPGRNHWHATFKTLKSNGLRARTNLVGTVGTQLCNGIY